jgi:enamine deaminase RidA (YjgF/YER057c/UK114 family)
MRRAIEPNPERTFAGMSQAVCVGDTLYVSGQVAFDEHGDIVDDDPKRQAEQCFRNIEALLDAAGGSAAEVVKLTCYLVDVAHYPAYAEAKARFLEGVTVPPAGTAVVVAGLLVPGLLMEVEAVAVLEGGRSA